MISEGIIKQKFVVEQLKDAAESAFRFQRNAFSSMLKSRSGATKVALTSPDYTIVGSDENFILTARITKQLRFQDLGVRKLYTKPLFSALKFLYGRLKYGFTDEIKEQIGQEIQNALNPE